MGEAIGQFLGSLLAVVCLAALLAGLVWAICSRH
jgi:hypothetical protein